MITKSAYKRLLGITIFVVFCLILIGGIVRSTGSGLGCPDWPKCFGSFVPPTHVSQLPENYKEIYKVAGKTIADFDAFKTWTEYLNRLFGAFTGFMILLTLLFSFSYKKDSRKVITWSFLAFIAVGFNGWLGAVVVSSHLKPIILTAHMIMAIVLSFILIYLHVITSNADSLVFGIEKNKADKLLKLGYAVIVITLIQVVLGTQVREEIDHVVKANPDLLRSLWISKLGLGFLIHRSFSLVLIIFQVLYLRGIWTLENKDPSISNTAKAMTASLALSVLSGISLAYLDFPRSMQPLHLLSALVLISIQFWSILLVRRSRMNMG